MLGRVRAAVALLAVVGAVLSGCGSDFQGVRLTMVTGSERGVYNALGNALADVWSGQLGIARPRVVPTPGSVENVGQLIAGQADVGFSQADATEGVGSGKLRALARIHDDYLQVVVRADLSGTRLADLQGLRVSIGEPKSGVELIATRLLKSAGVEPDIQHLSLESSIAAMLDGGLDAFFWSGGVPTRLITDLSKILGLRLLDLGDVLPRLREEFRVYGSATLPASTYELRGGPVTTLVVRNFLLVTESMRQDVAEALVRGLFEAQQRLVNAHSAAWTIEVRSAIETSPVELHPGAMRYYLEVKV